MWGRIVSSVSNALDFNQATLSGCIDIICVRNPHTGELHSTPFHVRFGKAKLLRSREKIVSVAVNNKPTALVMKLGAAGEAYFMQEVEDSIGVAEEDLASPLSSPVHSPRRSCGLSTDTSIAPAPQDSSSLPPSHPAQGATLSTAASAVAADTRRPGETQTGPDLTRGTNGLSPSLGSDGPIPKGAPAASVTTQDASSTWRSAWGTAARYEGSTAGLMEGSPSGSLPEGTLGRQAEEGRAAVQFSLCGHVLFGTADEAQHDADVFEANLVTWETLDENPSLWYHPSLVACFERTPPYYPAKVALPLLASWLLFNRPLSLDSVKRLMTADITYTDREGATWAPWQTDGVGSSSGVLRPRPEPLSSAEFSQGSPKRDQGATFSSGVNSDSESPAFAANREASTGKRLRRSLRPTPQQLESLDLKPGANSVCFTVSSALQGEKSVCGTIYLWPTDIKIVVSDVDGTITRSDVLGQLMPIVGRDWSHTGVAELFTKIKKSGYLILYLTARAIGQADATRDYLFGLTQKERDKLPDGPLILSPDRLFPSFRREVIDRKPYIFKIAALRDIRSLFPANRNPFYAGFGNRESDHRAYIHVGIPEAKIFIIDTAGVIHHISNSTYARTYETMSEIADHMFPPLKNSPVSRGQPGQELEEREEEEELCGACLQFNAFNYWSVAFEPHNEYGESEGGLSDEEEDSSVPVTSATGTAVLPESHTQQASACVQLPASQKSGKRTLALNYYFGLDQAEGSRPSLPATHAATAMASLGASSAAGDTSSPSDSSEDPFDGLSSSSSNSSNSSSSSSSSSSSYNYFRGPQLEACASVGIASEPTECIRRSASEGAELASLDRSEGDNSCPEKQQQRPSTANAPGRLSLPSVVSISSFRLGPLGFRRAKSATADAPAMQEDTAAARAGASPSEALTKPAAAVVDAACSGSHADVEGHLPTVHPKKQLPLDAFSQSSPQAKGASVAVPTESRHVLQPLGPGFRSAAALELQVGEAEEAGASMQARARTSDVTSAPSGGSLLAGRSEQHIRLKDKHVSADSCRSPSKVLPAARSSGSGSISPYQNRRSNSEDVVSAYSPLRTGVGGATFFRVQTEGGGPYMQTVGAIHAGSSSFRRNRALTHFTSARFEAGPTPASAVAPPSSATRPWLARSTREMHVCSSTSAMLMALAQETPERVQSPESPKAGIPRSSFSAAFAAAGAAAKAGELAARAAAGIRAPTAGATDGFGSYSSFESTDPLTSRCDSFASAASRTRNDDEANVQCTRQHQNQKKEKDAMDEECQQVGDRTAGIFAAPRTEACDSPLPGSYKESDAASPPSSR